MIMSPNFNMSIEIRNLSKYEVKTFLTADAHKIKKTPECLHEVKDDVDLGRAHYQGEFFAV